MVKGPWLRTSANRKPFLALVLVSTCLAACAAPRIDQTPEPEIVPPPVVETVPEEPVQPSGPVKIGLLLPLSGPASAVADDMLGAAQMALFDSIDNDFVLLPRDTGGDPQQAVRAAQSAIDAGAEIILGPLYSSATLAVRDHLHGGTGEAAPVLESGEPSQDDNAQQSATLEELVEKALNASANAPVSEESEADGTSEAEPIDQLADNPPAAPIKIISFSSNADIAGDGVYVIGFRPEEQVERIVRYAVSQALPRVAFLAPDDPYGAVARRGYRKGLQLSGSIASERLAFYPADAADQSDAVRRVSDFDARAAEVDEQRAELEARGDAAAEAALKALENIDTQTPPPFEAIVIADRSTRLRSVGALLAFYDVSVPDVQMLGTMDWLNDLTVMEEPNLEGSWVAAIDQERRRSFESLYAGRLGETPHPLAILAYDSVGLAVSVGLEDRSFPHSLIADPQGIDGMAGLFRFTEEGVTERALSVVELSRGGTVRLIDPAPLDFDPQGF